MTHGCALWFTGLSGAGKSTIAAAVFDYLTNNGVNAVLLDGDQLRRTKCADLGFTRQDRDKNVERIGSFCEDACSQGAVAIVAAISPYRAAREAVRRSISNFVEIYVRCPIEILIERDPKGLYRRALAGEIDHFTGISDPYEEPLNPELILDTSRAGVDTCVNQVIHLLFTQQIQLGNALSRQNA